MIRAIALDDEPLALEVIRNFCAQNSSVLLLETFTQSRKALQFLNEHKVDLLFLDINMPSVSGIDFYKSLSYKPLLIFTTAYEQYALEGFNLEAVDYLLKPFTGERFNTALQKVAAQLSIKEKAGDRHIMLKSDNVLQKVFYNDILYIEGMDNYLKVYLTNGKTMLTRMTIKAVTEVLPEDLFIRIHRSYIVAISKIESVKSNAVYIGNIGLSIGSNYKKDLQQYLKL